VKIQDDWICRLYDHR